MTDTPLIVGLGEALYDLLPVGPVLGGAPLNAAVQAHQIGRLIGGQAWVRCSGARPLPLLGLARVPLTLSLTEQVGSTQGPC